MRLTSKGRYAVAAMLDLALHGDGRGDEHGDGHGRRVALADISARQEIPVSYLGQLFARLHKHGLISSQRGPGGGYTLAKSAEEISIADVICAVDESVDSTRCGGKADCQGNQRCLTHGLWENLSRKIYDFLNETTLAEVLAEREAIKVAKRQDRLFASRHGVTPQWQNEPAGGMQ